MRVLFFGGNTSFIGKNIIMKLRSYGYQVFSCSRSPNDEYHIDYNNAEEIQKILNITRPDAIIITAFPLRDVCLAEPLGSNKFVSVGINNIVKAVEPGSAALIFLSSQDVYGNGYFYENDVPNPLGNNIYGKLKYDAENLIMQSKIKNWYILRFGVAFGEYLKPHNFIFKMLDAMKRGVTYKAYEDQVLTHIYLEDMANGIRSILETQMMKGIYHLYNPSKEEYSRYQVANMVKRHLKLEDLNIIPIKMDRDTKLNIPSHLLLRSQLVLEEPTFMNLEEAIKDCCLNIQRRQEYAEFFTSYHGV